MPPIWIPTEPMLAKPASAKEAMVKERGSRLAFSAPSWEKAMNSLRTARVPSSPPMTPLSRQGTPIAQAIGRPTQDRMVWRFSGNQASRAWIAPIPPFIRATRAMNDTSIAITLSISWRPSVVPRAAASTTFTSVLGISSLTFPKVSGSPVSGSNSLAIMMVPGAVMMTAVSKCRASIPNAR